MTTSRHLSSPPWSLRALLVLSLALPGVGTLFASLDIVPRKPGSDNIDLVLKDMDTGKLLGSFWNRDAGTSDYGFESSKAPVFYWNEDRSLVAIDYGNPRHSAVCLYRATAKTIKAIDLPELSPEQAAPLDAIGDRSAGGSEVAKWLPDGTLVIKYSAFGEAKQESGEAPEAHVWATVNITGLIASITTNSSVEPESAESAGAPDDAGMDAAKLAGKHQVSGKNSDGSPYKGTVKITVQDEVVSLEWTIGKTVSKGKGLLVGNFLGVKLDEGIALYSLVGQADGISLVGLWSGAGSTAVNPDTILIGNPDITSLDLSPTQGTGRYLSLRETDDGQVEADVLITGKGKAREITWSMGKKKTPCQAIAHSSGLAVLTPEGLAVYQEEKDDKGEAWFSGALLSAKGKRLPQSLTPVGK